MVNYWDKYTELQLSQQNLKFMSWNAKFYFSVVRIFRYICYPGGSRGGNSINCPSEGITVPLCLQCSRTLYHPSMYKFISSDLVLNIVVVYECAEYGQ